MHQAGSSIRRAIKVRAASVAAVVALVAVAAVVSNAAAYTVLGASFFPNHGAPGIRIVVDGLPLAADCPTVDVWLAPGITASPPIVSAADTRLIRLRGQVRHVPGGVSLGDTRRGTTFVFRVPAIAAGTYSTYSRCIGGSAGFAGFGTGNTTFTIDHPPPNTDAIDPVAGQGQVPGVLPMVAGLIAGLIFLLRRTCSGRESGGAPSSKGAAQRWRR